MLKVKVCCEEFFPNNLINYKTLIMNVQVSSSTKCFSILGLGTLFT